MATQVLAMVRRGVYTFNAMQTASFLLASNKRPIVTLDMAAHADTRGHAAHDPWLARRGLSTGYSTKASQREGPDWCHN